MPKRSMTKQEFERLAGYEISDTDYRNIIEPMYMATSLNKREFIRCINKKRFAPLTEDELIAAMKKEARHIMEAGDCEHTDSASERRLERYAQECARRFWNATDTKIERADFDDWFGLFANAMTRDFSFPINVSFYNAQGQFVGRIELLNKNKEIKKNYRIITANKERTIQMTLEEYVDNSQKTSQFQMGLDFFLSLYGHLGLCRGENGQIYEYATAVAMRVLDKMQTNGNTKQVLDRMPKRFQKDFITYSDSNQQFVLVFALWYDLPNDVLKLLKDRRRSYCADAILENALQGHSAKEILKIMDEGGPACAKVKERRLCAVPYCGECTVNINTAMVNGYINGQTIVVPELNKVYPIVKISKEGLL